MGRTTPTCTLQSYEIQTTTPARAHTHRRLKDVEEEERLSKDQQYDTLPIGTSVSRDFLEVHKGGLTFRLLIHCDR